MYIQVTGTKSVGLRTLLKTFLYVYVYPQNGYYTRLRLRFGVNAQLHINPESALTLVLKNVPGKHPGMYVAVDQKHEKRFKKIIERLGLKMVTYSGELQLLEACRMKHVLLVVVPDTYSSMSKRIAKEYALSSPIKLAYQHRVEPKPFELVHDVYLWQPKNLPRSMTGAVLVPTSDKAAYVSGEVKLQLSDKPRMSHHIFLAELYRAWRGRENTYRRLDVRPPKVLARLLYDMYK